MTKKQIACLSIIAAIISLFGVAISLQSYGKIDFSNWSTQFELDEIVNPGCYNRQYQNHQHGLQFCYPESWSIIEEKANVGGSLYRVRFSEPNFVDDGVLGSDFIAAMTVTKKEMEEAIGYLNLVINKSHEEYIYVDGRSAVLTQGKHEFGGEILVAIVENGSSSIQFVLSTTEEPYISDFKTLLSTFKFDRTLNTSSKTHEDQSVLISS